MERDNPTPQLQSPIRDLGQFGSLENSGRIGVGCGPHSGQQARPDAPWIQLRSELPTDRITVISVSAQDMIDSVT